MRKSSEHAAQKYLTTDTPHTAHIELFDEAHTPIMERQDTVEGDGLNQPSEQKAVDPPKPKEYQSLSRIIEEREGSPPSTERVQVSTGPAAVGASPAGSLTKAGAEQAAPAPSAAAGKSGPPGSPAFQRDRAGSMSVLPSQSLAVEKRRISLTRSSSSGNESMTRNERRMSGDNIDASAAGAEGARRPRRASTTSVTNSAGIEIDNIPRSGPGPPSVQGSAAGSNTGSMLRGKRNSVLGSGSVDSNGRPRWHNKLRGRNSQSQYNKSGNRQAQLQKRGHTLLSVHTDLDEDEDEDEEPEGKDDDDEGLEDLVKPISDEDVSDDDDGQHSVLVVYEEQPSAQESLPFHWDANMLKGYSRHHVSAGQVTAAALKPKSRQVAPEGLRSSMRGQREAFMKMVATMWDRFMERWAPVTITAAMVALFAFGLYEVALPIGNARREWTRTLLERDGELTLVWAAIMWACSSVFLVSLASIVVVVFAPRAAGSGIPETKAFLNGCQLRGLFNTRTLVVKLIGLALMLPSGVPVGREGPMVHAGAALAAVISWYVSELDAAKYWHGYGFQWERRDLITCGVAAGISAAFISPIGGVLFALEDVASYWSVKVTWKTFICAAMAVLTRNILFNKNGDAFTSQSLTGEGGDEDWSTRDLFMFMLLGSICGALMAFYTHIATFLVGWERKQKWLKGYNGLKKVGLAAALTLAVSVVTFAVPFLAECKPDPHYEGYGDPYPPTSSDAGYLEADRYGVCVAACAEEHHQEHSSAAAPHRRRLLAGGGDYGVEYERFTCDAGMYNPLATLYLPVTTGASEHALEILLSRESTGRTDFSIAQLAVFAATFFVIMFSVITMPVPYDLFDPNMVFGAAIGRLFGIAMDQLGISSAHEGTYALMGMGATLGSFSRMTIAISVILVELTGDANMLLPVMLSIWMANSTADFLCPESFIAQVGLIKRLRILEEYPSSEIVKLEARHSMTEHVQTVESTDTFEHIAHLLVNTRHNGFPVVDSIDEQGNRMLKPRFRNFVTRRKLFVMLRAEMKMHLRELPELVTNERVRIPPGLLGETVDVLGKLGGNRALYTNLGMVVQPDVPMYRVYRFFSQLGMRHVCVVDSSGMLQGVITRSNILLLDAAEEAAEEALAEQFTESPSKKDQDVEKDRLQAEDIYDDEEGPEEEGSMRSLPRGLDFDGGNERPGDLQMDSISPRPAEDKGTGVYNADGSEVKFAVTYEV